MTGATRAGQAYQGYDRFDRRIARAAADRWRWTEEFVRPCATFRIESELLGFEVVERMDYRDGRGCKGCLVAHRVRVAWRHRFLGTSGQVPDTAGWTTMCPADRRAGGVLHEWAEPT